MSRPTLTEKQLKVYNLLDKMLAKGVPPSVREICTGTGIKSTSTVHAILGALEENGYINRIPLPNDKRQFSVYPTEKMLAVLPEIKSASEEWMALLSDGISGEELAVFNSVLERMQARAGEIIEKQD